MRYLLCLCFVSLATSLAVTTSVASAPLPARQQPSAASSDTPAPFMLTLAGVILSSDPDWPAPPQSVVLSKAIVHLALQQQLLDTREVAYFFNTRESWEADLRLLRKRHADLKDAPLVEDAYRFPDRSTSAELLAFNRKYKQFLEDNQKLDLVNEQWYRDALQETDALYRLWDTVRDAQTGYYYGVVRRDALARLRAELGSDAYNAGKLPPPVPVWRFTRID